jgi:hypothetical protein
MLELALQIGHDLRGLCGVRAPSVRRPDLFRILCERRDPAAQQIEVGS